jgi:hypothetical protein
MSLNGKGKYNKCKMVLQIVKEFMQQFPDTTFEEIKATFRRDYLQNYAQFEFIQDDIETAKNWSKFGEDHSHYFIKDDEIIVSGDGIPFVVCVE